MKTYKIISDEEEGDRVEVTESEQVGKKTIYSKAELEAKKSEIDTLLAEFK